jgi:aconitate hydratase
MGVLPLQFVQGQTAASLKLAGNEMFHITGVRAIAADGAEIDFEAVPRVDTPREAEYFRHGGILPFVSAPTAGHRLTGRREPPYFSNLSI